MSQARRTPAKSQELESYYTEVVMTVLKWIGIKAARATALVAGYDLVASAVHLPVVGLLPLVGVFLALTALEW